MDKFKVGDNVRINSTSIYYGVTQGNPKKEDVVHGEILSRNSYCEVDGERHNYQVRWQLVNGTSEICFYREKDLYLYKEKIEPPKYMPKGYMWTGELRVPKDGEYYIGAARTNPQPTSKKPNAFTQCENNDLSANPSKLKVNTQRYIIKPLNPMFTEKELKEEKEIMLGMDYGKAEKTVMALVANGTIKTYEENLFIKPTSEEDIMTAPITSTETTEQIFPGDTNGNIKFLRGYVEKNLTKEKALSMLEGVNHDIDCLTHGTGADTLYIKEKIDALQKDADALVAILNDKKRK